MFIRASHYEAYVFSVKRSPGSPAIAEFFAWGLVASPRSEFDLNR